MLQFIVPLGDFRAALAAVKPHVSSDKKEVQSRCVVISLTETRQILATASDGLTSGVARIPFREDLNPRFELGQFTLTPETCKTVIDMFTLDKNEPDTDMEISVRFTDQKEPGQQEPIRVATIEFRRLGQLFGGDQLRVTEPVQKRDITGLWATISTASARKENKLPPIKVAASRLALFKSAESVYNSPLRITADNSVTSGICVYVGNLFAGWIAADRVDIDDASQRRHTTARQIWAECLPAGLKAM